LHKKIELCQVDPYHTCTTPPTASVVGRKARFGGPLLFLGAGDARMFYIDGFNLYYGALRGTPHKWLDVKALFGRILRPENDILKIKYYTARVSAWPDNPDAPTKQDFYLQALAAHIPELEITEGHFIQKPVTMRLMNKMRFRRSMYVRVLKSEEKGSDVNLSVHLVNDAWNNPIPGTSIHKPPNW